MTRYRDRDDRTSEEETRESGGATASTADSEASATTSSTRVLGPDPQLARRDADLEMARLMEDFQTPTEADPPSPITESLAPTRIGTTATSSKAVAALTALLAIGAVLTAREIWTSHTPSSTSPVQPAGAPAPTVRPVPREPVQIAPSRPVPARERARAAPASTSRHEIPDDGCDDPDDCERPETPGSSSRAHGPPRDPRAVPAGTSEEAADAFRKLPVSAADRPPVGGIGSSGVHIDRIELGNAYDKSRCQGKRDDFSISDRDRISVCFRVVHYREREPVHVLWHKDDGTRRHTKLYVEPNHAYRTRAYMVLRREYLGHWTVRVQSDDGVELGSASFSVVD